MVTLNSHANFERQSLQCYQLYPGKNPILVHFVSQKVCLCIFEILFYFRYNIVLSIVTERKTHSLIPRVSLRSLENPWRSAFDLNYILILFLLLASLAVTLLIPVSVAWSDKVFLLPPLMGCKSIAPMYTPGWREAVWELSVLPNNTIHGSKIRRRAH